MKYGIWRPDVPDHNDYLAAPKPKVALRTIVAPMAKKRKRENQGNLGSCTGNGGTSAFELILKLDEELSRMMAYYNARAIEGTIRQDAGAQIRDMIKGMVKVGVSSEITWPYDIKKFKTKPSAQAYTEASALVEKIKSVGLVYERVSGSAGVIQAINANQPVIFGFMVPQQFENLPKSGILDLPRKGEPSLGGHCVFADGYDRKQGFAWIQNSWGPKWGLDGYCKMPFEWFDDKRRLVDDAWTLRRTK